MNSDKTMDTLVIQLTHQKALRLILELEDLHLIRVLKHTQMTQPKLSEKYTGKLSAVSGKQLQKHIKQSRDEWESRI
jgi:hypothetical protein